jgi:hypothetical protein
MRPRRWVISAFIATIVNEDVEAWHGVLRFKERRVSQRFLEEPSDPLEQPAEKAAKHRINRFRQPQIDRMLGDCVYVRRRAERESVSAPPWGPIVSERHQLVPDSVAFIGIQKAMVCYGMKMHDSATFLQA